MGKFLGIAGGKGEPEVIYTQAEFNSIDTTELVIGDEISIIDNYTSPEDIIPDEVNGERELSKTPIQFDEIQIKGFYNVKLSTVDAYTTILSNGTKPLVQANPQNQTMIFNIPLANGDYDVRSIEVNGFMTKFEQTRDLTVKYKILTPNKIDISFLLNTQGFEFIWESLETVVLPSVTSITAPEAEKAIVELNKTEVYHSAASLKLLRKVIWDGADFKDLANTNATPIDGEVNTYAELPKASHHYDEIYIVHETTGTWLLGTKKQAGLYTPTGGIWSFLSDDSQQAAGIDLTSANSTSIRRWSPTNIKEIIANFAQEKLSYWRMAQSGNNFQLKNNIGQVAIEAQPYSSVTMSYGNNPRLKTVSAGVSVTGNVELNGTVDGVDVGAIPTTYARKNGNTSEYFYVKTGKIGTYVDNNKVASCTEVKSYVDITIAGITFSTSGTEMQYGANFPDNEWYTNSGTQLVNYNSLFAYLRRPHKGGVITGWMYDSHASDKYADMWNDMKTLGWESEYGRLQFEGGSYDLEFVMGTYNVNIFCRYNNNSKQGEFKTSTNAKDSVYTVGGIGRSTGVNTTYMAKVTLYVHGKYFLVEMFNVSYSSNVMYRLTRIK